jgi:bifunctional DNA-binding transcriptional regulator/antitoxin component of YhaV-PrlF toxin-antitoxin module
MNDIVYEPVSIKVSGRHQIVVPSVAHLHLGIRSVDRFLVYVQNRLLILLMKPDDVVARLSGHTTRCGMSWRRWAA